MSSIKWDTLVIQSDTDCMSVESFTDHMSVELSPGLARCWLSWVLWVRVACFYAKKSIIIYMPPVLHTLNAVRVLAEYCIVSYHIYFGHPVSIPENYDIGYIISSHGVSVDLMSLFFVLSGFASMYSSDRDETDNEFRTRFIIKRFKKTYPCYVLSLLTGLPHFFMSYFAEKTSCILDIAALICQFFCLQCWIGCRFAGSNSPSWYIGTVTWLWVVFPFMNLNGILNRRPWMWVAVFYVLSIICNILFVNYESSNVRKIPIIRLFEFLMGCATACTLNESYTIHSFFIALMFGVYCGYACLTTAYSSIWEIKHDPPQCVLWQRVSESKNFPVGPGTFLTLTSIVWALLFHWLATQELANSPNIVIRVLQFDFFRSLSSYSLQLYLFHLPISDCVQGFFKICNAHMWLSKDIIMVTCYSFSYAIYVYVQPFLDRLVNRHE